MTINHSIPINKDIDEDNPYLNSRKDWNELMGKEKANVVLWRMIAIISNFITLVAVCGVIYTSTLPKLVPYLFKEDASGGITALGIPNTALRVDNRILANQLAIFIQYLRQIPSSTELKRNQVRQVKMMSKPELFQNKLAPMMKDAYASIGSGELNIEIKTILPIAKDTWEISWIENKAGVQTGRFKAVINYSRNTSLLAGPTDLIWNPLAIIVTDISINQDIGG